jgi:hypothetical protein
MSRAKLIAFCLLLLGAFAASAQAGPLVVIWLEDGRMLAGEVDPRTNDERLWLRATSPTFVVATSAIWKHIKAVNANGERLPVEEFSKRVDEFRPQEPDPNAMPAPAREAVANVTTPVTRSIQQANAATRVVSLDVEARVANWDQDAAIDGVEIRVFPRNTFGEIVPVSGQITARLVARDRLPVDEASAFPQFGNWSLQTDTSDFRPYGAVYRLPFRSRHPDQLFSLEPHGLVEVTLFASGQGRFNADAPIYIQRFNPVRRGLQFEATQRDR